MHGRYFLYLRCGLCVLWNPCHPRLRNSSFRVLLYLFIQTNQNYHQPGSHFLLRLLAWEFSGLLNSINWNENLCETQALSFDFSGENFLIWVQAEIDILSCYLVKPADRFFPNLYFPWDCGPPRMPVILTPCLNADQISYFAPCGQESPSP